MDFASDMMIANTRQQTMLASIFKLYDIVPPNKYELLDTNYKYYFSWTLPFSHTTLSKYAIPNNLFIITPTGKKLLYRNIIGYWNIEECKH